MFYAYAQRRRGIKVPSGIDMARRDLAARKPLNDAAGQVRVGADPKLDRLPATTQAKGCFGTSSISTISGGQL